MKGSVVTGKTWLLLIAAALLIAAGALNFSQRLRHKSPRRSSQDPQPPERG